MATTKQRLLPSQQVPLSDLGERLRHARIRRGIRVDLMASRAGIPVRTLLRIELGDASISIRSYSRVLAELGLEKDLDLVGRDGDLIRRHSGVPAVRRIRGD